MRSTPPHAAPRWDGSPVHVPARRSLRVDPDSVSLLLRCGQSDRCRDCGNRIEWYHRSRQRPVRLHPRELPVTAVPTACRWHVSSGIAHPAGDGTRWCSLPHAVLCPAQPATEEAPELVGLRRLLAVNTRRLIDAGAFTRPPRSPTTRRQPLPTAARPGPSC
ncbi:DUF6083 domain-containing protein [Streptomyces sp. NPDC060187]|uniref:DUF6083 domain-containing protein n=1 Tax=Streptomyces sp. NPDC060187 TaxID=3347067 RepID=UPI003659CC99